MVSIYGVYVLSTFFTCRYYRCTMIHLDTRADPARNSPFHLLTLRSDESSSAAFSQEEKPSSVSARLKAIGSAGLQARRCIGGQLDGVGALHPTAWWGSRRVF